MPRYRVVTQKVYLKPANERQPRICHIGEELKSMDRQAETCSRSTRPPNRHRAAPAVGSIAARSPQRLLGTIVGHDVRDHRRSIARRDDAAVTRCAPWHAWMRAH